MQEQKLLSKKWQKRFEIIDSLEIKSVSGFYAALRTATFKDRLAAQFKMHSILAFLFGPLYYLILGMWRKALFLVGLGMVIGLLNGSIYYAVYGDYVEGEEGYFSSVLRFEVIAFQFFE